MSFFARGPDLFLASHVIYTLSFPAKKLDTECADLSAR
jgi:hypothetical protein